jgi:hypothetical protein
MSERSALTEGQKARLYDQLIASRVIVFRTGTRFTKGTKTETTWIEQGETKDMPVVQAWLG